MKMEYKFDILKDAERILAEMRSKPWEKMNTHEAAVQY